MTDLVIFVAIVGLVVAVGVLVGMIVAGRLDRIMNPAPAPPAAPAPASPPGSPAPAAARTPPAGRVEPEPDPGRPTSVTTSEEQQP